jgi:hypothetical protein
MDGSSRSQKHGDVPATETEDEPRWREKPRAPAGDDGIVLQRRNVKRDSRTVSDSIRPGTPHAQSIRRWEMPNKRANVKNEKQYEALKDKGMSKERAARIANSPGASRRGGKKSGSGGSSSQGGTTAQKKAAGRKGGKATARKR